MRLRWFDIEIDRAELAALGERMLVDDFGDRRPSGFRLERSGPRAIEGRYIERAEWTETVTAPGGREFQIGRLAFLETAFALKTTRPGLEIAGSSRSARGFVSRLEEYRNFSGFVSPLLVDPVRWAFRLRAELPGLVITNIVTETFELSTTCSARVTISGSKALEKELYKLCAGRRPAVRQLTVEWSVDSRRHSCVLMRDCSVKFAKALNRGGVTDSFRRSVRTTLGEQAVM